MLGFSLALTLYRPELTLVLLTGNLASPWSQPQIPGGGISPHEV